MSERPHITVSHRTADHAPTLAIQGVLFDLDNTLFDRDQTFLGWAQWFVRERMGIATTDAARPVVDMLVELDANGYGPKDALFHTLKQRYPALAEDVAVLTAAFYEQHLAYVALNDDTRDLLARLRDHDIPWGIVTNGSTNQLLKITRLGFDNLTRCVFVSEVEGIRKPEPEIFLRAARCLNVAPPSILFAGDNPDADIIGARAVGMRTAWLRRGRPWPSAISNDVPDLVIDTFADLAIGQAASSEIF